MSITTRNRLVLVGAILVTANAAFAQVDMQLRARQLPGWDRLAREGRCEIRLWVDSKAEVRMRGDSIFVRTVEGSKARDEGSECSHPLPYNAVGDFQIRQLSGRSHVVLAQEPSRMNNYTATIGVDDRQGGGDAYAFEVTWRATPDVAAAPEAFFDDVRACQEGVRQRFVGQNGRGAYIDFEAFADRRMEDRGRGERGNFAEGGRRGRGQETIQGRGSARRSTEARDLTYSCVIDSRQSQVLSADYQYSSSSSRTSGRRDFGRPLR
jgi:hypothetical protein